MLYIKKKIGNLPNHLNTTNAQLSQKLPWSSGVNLTMGELILLLAKAYVLESEGTFQWQYLQMLKINPFSFYWKHGQALPQEEEHPATSSPHASPRGLVSEGKECRTLQTQTVPLHVMKTKEFVHSVPSMKHIKAY